jgi:hypothetical protein
MPVIVNEKMMGFMVRAAFFFEPLAPTAISYYLGRKLSQWKKEGLISDYKTDTQRLGKFRYNIQLDLDLTPRQACMFLTTCYLSKQTS